MATVWDGRRGLRLGFGEGIHDGQIVNPSYPAGKTWIALENTADFPLFFCCFPRSAHYFPRSTKRLNQEKNVNSELCRAALAKVGNPNVLVNLISRRVRQLNSAGGIGSRPLLSDTAGLGAADIALRELIDEKMGWEEPEELQLVEATPKKRRRS